MPWESSSAAALIGDPVEGSIAAPEKTSLGHAAEALLYLYNTSEEATVPPDKSVESVLNWNTPERVTDCAFVAVSVQVASVVVLNVSSVTVGYDGSVPSWAVASIYSKLNVRAIIIDI